MPQRPPKLLKQHVAEAKAMHRARAAAEQTPQEVREAFLARRRQIGPVFIEPFSLGILWLFEELKHPFNEGIELMRDATGEPMPLLDEKGRQKQDDEGNALFRTEPLSMRDAARAIFIFHDSEAAGEAHAGGSEAFDGEALTLARGIAPHFVPEIIAAIQKTFTEGLATLPGAGGANPPRTGS